MKRRLGLVWPTTIAMVVAAIVPVFVLGWMTSVNQKADLRDELLGSLAVVADTQHARLDAHVRLARTSLGLIASRTQMRDLFVRYDPADRASVDRLRRILNDASDATDELRTVTLVDLDGNVVVSTGDPATLPSFDVWSIRESGLGDLLSHVDKSQGSSRWWVATPLFVGDEIVGLVVAERDLTRMGILGSGGEQTDIYTTCVVAPQDGQLSPVTAPAGWIRAEVCNELQRRIGRFYPGIVHVSREVTPVNWQVTVASSTDRLFAPIDNATRRLVWLTVAVGIVAAAIALVVARWLTAPLRHLHDVVTQVRRGQDVVADTDAPGEIGELAEAFNAMTSTIKRDQADMADRYADLEVLTHAMAHDLKAPLTSIRAVCETLSSGRLDSRAQQLELLQRGGQAAERMQRLIDDLLALIQTIGAPVERRRVDLNDMCTLIVDELGIGDAVHVQRLPSVFADPTLTRQALANLMTNAVAYHPVDVETQVEVSGESSMTGTVIRIDDAGVGFDDAEHETVIEAFARGRGAKLHPGTGLGLSIVQRTMARHNGTMTLGRSPLGGARVELRFPPAEIGDVRTRNRS